MALQYLDTKLGIALDAVMRRHGCYNLVDARHDSAETEFRGSTLKSIVIGVTDLLRQFRALDERLARYAAEIETIPTHLVSFDQCDLGPDRGRYVGTNKPGGAAANND